MKSLKDYGIKFPSLKTVVGELNKSGLAKTKVKVTGSGASVLENFLNAMDSVPEKQMGDVPKSVSEFYESLPQGVFDDSDNGGPGSKDKDAGSKDAGDGDGDDTKVDEPTSECPTYKKGWNPKEDDCKACEKDFPDEYATCMEATKKSKKKKAPSGTKREAARKSRYGHTLNTMSGDIDDLLFIGGNIDDMAKVIADRHDRTESKARAKIRAHAGYLVSIHSLKLHESDGDLQIKTPYRKGFNKDNTTVTLDKLVVPKAKKAAPKKK